MTKALDLQVGGNHYKTGIQPFELSHANAHDGTTHAIQKYLTRHARLVPEEGYKSIRKAHHITALRAELLETYPAAHPDQCLIQINHYISANGIDNVTANAMRHVEFWHQDPTLDPGATASIIRDLILSAAEHHYPQLFKKEDFV